MRRALCNALLALSALGPVLACAEPANPTDFIVGVHTHLFDQPGDVRAPSRLLREAGVGSVADDAYWSTVEQAPGVLHTPPDWLKYLREQQAGNQGNVLMLGYGNRFYANDSKPIAPSVRAGYARFVAYVAQALKGQVGFYEVWNEWDLEDPTSPAFTQAYLDLVQATARQLHRIDPAARLLAGTVTTQGIKAGYADRLVQGGLLDQVDGLSLHPYVHCEKTGSGNTPEAWIEWLRAVSAHLDTLAGRPVPLYLTEMGWHSTGALHPCGVDEATQAAWLARAYLLAKTLPAIKGLWWYDLANDGPNPAEPEHNFGLLRQDLNPKPAYWALSRVAPVLNGYRYLPHEQLPAVEGTDDLVRLVFGKGPQRVVAVWAQGAARVVTLKAPGQANGPVQLSTTGPTDESPTPVWRCTPQGCFTRLRVSAYPVLVTLQNVPDARPLPDQAGPDSMNRYPGMYSR